MPAPNSMEIHISFRTVLLTFAAIFLARGFGPLSRLILPLILSAILAASILPLVEAVTRRGLRRSFAISALLVSFLGGVAAGSYFLLPRLYGEIANFIDELPRLQNDLLGMVPVHSPFRHFVSQAFASAARPTAISAEHILFAGSLALEGLAETLLVIVFTIYLVIDGPRIVAWISAFFRPSTEAKLRHTFTEVSKVISAYVSGQVLTSALSFLYVLLVTRWIGIPSGLLLASLAAVFDILPVLGFFLAVVPAMLFALRVSPLTPLYVLALYLFYHGLENYAIGPAVYGNRMRLSSFVVLLSLIMAGLLGGVEGAIVVLPIVASYPIVERIWLKPIVSEETVEKHAEIEKAG